MQSEIQASNQSLPVNQILHGDALERLRTLPDRCIDCVVTSPPYWGMRDYKAEGQLGMEQWYDEYVNKLLEIFDEVDRVLKQTGALWVNIGDKYSADKSLMAIPDHFKIEMMERGWTCRNEIIWYKPNCMPSSAKNRFTIDYEKLFFFVKRNADYYFETQYEPYRTFENRPHGITRQQTYGYDSKYNDKSYKQKLVKYATTPYKGKALKEYEPHRAQNPSDTKRRILESMQKQMPKFGGNRAGKYNNPTYSGKEWAPVLFGRIKRCVWQITTRGFKDAHFAVFPEELVRTPILATCPFKICDMCGTPWIRNVEEERIATRPGRNVGKGKSGKQADPNKELHTSDLSKYRQTIVRKAGGYVTNCKCEYFASPGVVLDPFIGAGTTALMALKLKRNFIGIELNADYIAIANKRLDAWRSKG